ncbi:translation initiation factor IF-2-like [Moschus berezovskii]|uniref:translation initiation factor IF-2-like n=1 Tax=Moschus berezovskii TaxID=68408 RepID=UPI002444BDD6|nr:translation initiation factor IF-2-like [Moschus berezovskii]
MAGPSPRHRPRPRPAGAPRVGAALGRSARGRRAPARRPGRPGESVLPETRRAGSAAASAAAVPGSLPARTKQAEARPRPSSGAPAVPPTPGGEGAGRTRPGPRLRGGESGRAGRGAAGPHVSPALCARPPGAQPETRSSRGPTPAPVRLDLPGVSAARGRGLRQSQGYRALLKCRTQARGVALPGGERLFVRFPALGSSSTPVSTVVPSPERAEGQRFPLKPGAAAPASAPQEDQGPSPAVPDRGPVPSSLPREGQGLRNRHRSPANPTARPGMRKGICDSRRGDHWGGKGKVSHWGLNSGRGRRFRGKKKPKPSPPAASPGSRVSPHWLVRIHLVILASLKCIYGESAARPAEGGVPPLGTLLEIKPAPSTESATARRARSRGSGRPGLQRPSHSLDNRVQRLL